MNIRKAQSYDFPLVFALYTHPVNNLFLNLKACPQDEFQGHFNEWLAEEELYIYETSEDSEGVGMFSLKWGKNRLSHVVKLGSVAITAEKQGQGLGSSMIEDILNYLKSRGIQRVELMVEVDNTRAIQLYQKHGFTIEGTLQKYFHRGDQYIDDYVMAKLI